MLEVERKTGIRFSDYVQISQHPERVQLSTRNLGGWRGAEPDVKRSLEHAQPMLMVPEAWLLQGAQYSASEREAIILHEMGHQHFAPLREKFWAEARVAEAFETLEQLAEKGDRNEQVLAAQICGFYDVVGRDFFADVKRLKEIVAERYKGMEGSDPLRGATDEKAASLLLKEFARLHQGGKAKTSGLEAYTQLPPLSMEFMQIATRLACCLTEKPGAAQIAKYAGKEDEVFSALFGALEMGHSRVAAARCLKRGEELLCDDYAALHAKSPRDMACVLIKLKAGSAGSFMGYPMGGSTHPSDDQRITRSEALCKHIEAVKAMCGHAAQPRDYAEWVHRQSEESLDKKKPQRSTMLPGAFY